MIYTLLSFIDRLFIAGFYAAHDLGVYALAFQLVLMALVGLQAWTYIASTHIGEALSRPEDLQRVVRRTILVALFSPAVAAAAGCTLGLVFSRPSHPRYHRTFLTAP